MRFLDINDIEYEMNGQQISFSKSILTDNDIPWLYIKTLAQEFESNSKFNRIIGNRFRIEKLNADGTDNLNEKEQKELKELYKTFSELMLKSSYKSLYNVLPGYDGISLLNAEMIEDFKKEENPIEKYKKYLSLIEIINQEKVKFYLIYTEILYTSLKLFFNDNPMSKKITCLCETNKKYETTFYNNFIFPLLEESEIEEKNKKNFCIECLNKMSAKNKKAFTFLVDTADDVSKKKSYYWNCSPDAFVCPLCNFIYAFIPLGFAFMGANAVFINLNSSAFDLKRIMESQRKKTDDDTHSSIRKRIMRTFTSEKINSLENFKSNIQVIIRSPDISHFQFEVIDKQMIDKLHKGSKYLSMLEKIWISSGEKFSSVYDMTFDKLLNHMSLYPVIDKILKLELDKSNNINYLKGILRLEIIFYGGAIMEELSKKVNIAFQSGIELRKSILGKNADIPNAEDDNKLRGFVYRLVNLASVGDCPQFIDTVIRVYAGFGLTIPAVFKDCYKSDDMFKAIAHGFILGLKYVKFIDNKESNENG